MSICPAMQPHDVTYLLLLLCALKQNNLLSTVRWSVLQNFRLISIWLSPHGDTILYGVDSCLGKSVKPIRRLAVISHSVYYRITILMYIPFVRGWNCKGMNVLQYHVTALYIKGWVTRFCQFDGVLNFQKANRRSSEPLFSSWEHTPQSPTNIKHNESWGKVAGWQSKRQESASGMVSAANWRLQ